MTIGIDTCDICAAAGVGTPATRASVHRISGWMGSAGAHTAHICESCYAQLRVTALDGAIDEAVQGDFPAS